MSETVYFHSETLSRCLFGFPGVERLNFSERRLPGPSVEDEFEDDRDAFMRQLHGG